MLWATLNISVIFVFYTYVGYPLILFILRKFENEAYPSSVYKGDVTIVMVVCNEEKLVVTKINNLLNLNFPNGKVNIIVVDDNSDDDTVYNVKQFAEKVTLIQSASRLGKANGLNLAMEAVSTELTMMVDCRQEIESDALIYLSSWFAEDDKVGAISGELMFKAEGANDFSQGMDGYWKYEKFIRSSEALIASVPGVSGAIYMLRTSAFKPIPINTLLDDVQIPMEIARQGFKVGYDDRAIAWDVPSVSLGNEKRRKIRTLSGNYQLLQRFPQWILPLGHPIAWQFFSHKIARLIAPFIALLSFVVALILGVEGDALASIYAVLFLLGVLTLPMSHLFPKLSQVSLIKLLVSFLTLNWFCILALFNYLFASNSGSWKK